MGASAACRFIFFIPLAGVAGSPKTSAWSYSVLRVGAWAASRFRHRVDHRLALSDLQWKRKKKRKEFPSSTSLSLGMSRLHDGKKRLTLARHPLVEFQLVKEETISLVRNLGSFCCQHQRARTRGCCHPSHSALPPAPGHSPLPAWPLSCIGLIITLPSSPILHFRPRNPDAGVMGRKEGRLHSNLPEVLFPHQLGPFGDARIHRAPSRPGRSGSDGTAWQLI